MSGEFTLTVLGCDGSYPGPLGACSGYLLCCGETRVWLDAGPGTLAQLQSHIAVEELDAVIITHQHIDHWSDLEHLAVACRWVLNRPAVPVYCEFDLAALMRTPAGDALALIAIDPDARVTVGELTFTFSRTDHPVDTLAVRADGRGRSLGYSADSGPGWGLSQLGSGLDLALCEATFLSDMEDSLFHMSARQAGRSARIAGVNRLVITHLWPRIDRRAAAAEAAAEFGADVVVAATGRSYRV